MSVSLNSGTLYIQGTSGNDYLHVQQYDGIVEVEDNDEVHYYNADEIDNIQIDAYEGDDNIYYVNHDGSSDATYNLDVDGGDGEDSYGYDPHGGVSSVQNVEHVDRGIHIPNPQLEED